MRHASAYAKVLPRLRVLYSKLVPEDRLREASSTASLSDALQELRDTPYGAAAEAPRLGEALKSIFSVYASRVEAIARNSPPQAREAAEAFIREEMLRDSMAVLAALLGGTYLDIRSLVTYVVEDSPLRVLAQDPEALSSPQRMVEALARFKWLEPMLSRALELSQQARDPRAVDIYTSAAAVELYSRALEPMEGYGRRASLAILCPRLEYIAAAAAVEASLQGIPPRILAAASPELDACDSWRGMASAYEREQTPEALLAYLRQARPELGFEGKTPREALRNASRVSRERVRAAALRAFKGYPLHGGMVVATLSLARLEYEAVKALVAATALRLHPDEYYRELVVPPT